MYACTLEFQTNRGAKTMFERETHLEAIKSILNAAWKLNHIIECNYDLFPEWNSDIMGHNGAY